MATADMSRANKLKNAGYPIAEAKRLIDQGTRLTITQSGEIVGRVETLVFHLNANTLEVVLADG